MTALCPFIEQYAKVIRQEYPSLEIVFGTHQPIDKRKFQEDVRELLCPAVPPKAMTDLIMAKRST
jgi:hypothetical protein